jgi:hypothetical protein
MDRIAKPAQYAAAGIGAYWRVETAAPGLTAYVLERDAAVYTELGTRDGTGVAHISRPFPVDLDLAALLDG